MGAKSDVYEFKLNYSFGGTAVATIKAQQVREGT
jgi:hypothetical protein